MLAACVLALVLLLPTAGQARFGGRQLEISKECDAPLPDQSILRAAGPCKGQALVKTPLTERIAISGKVGRALAVALYCRSSTNVSALSGVITPYLPHPSPHRLIRPECTAAADQPAGRLGPALDTPKVEAFLVARLPDG